MRLVTIAAALILCSLAVTVDTKPTFISYKVVPIPIVVPKINILGLVGKVVGAKAALVGKVIGAKKTLIHHLLGSSSGPVIGVVNPPPLPAVFPEPIYPAAAPPPLPPPPPPPPLKPTTSYGTPADESNR